MAAGTARLIGQSKSNSETSPRKRADVLLVERGLFESRARARAAIEAGLVVANDKPVAKPSEVIAADAVLQAEPAHPYVSRGGVKLAGALEQYPIDDRGPCLPRRRRLHRRLHRGAAGQRRGHGVCDRCRPRPAASLAARPSEDRVDGSDRHPQARGQAAAGAARHRRHRRQLHFAEGRAAGGAVAGGGAHAPARADQAAIRGGAEDTTRAASSATPRCTSRSATISRRSRPRSAAPTSRCSPRAIAGGDGNIEFFLGARRG